MDQQKKEALAQALQSKGVNHPCPRCGSHNFEVVGQTLIPLHENFTKVTIGGPGVPAGIVACPKCGFITLHALGPLGLISQSEKK